jgi:uncharacterized protein (TIGR02246 family)
MLASNPQDLPQLFLQKMSAGDADGVASLFEPNGIIAPDPENLVIGQAAIREMASGFLAQGPSFALHEVEVVRAGDIALVRSRWTITSTDPDGKKTEMKVRPSLVARRQPAGHWLVVIDRPLPIE